MAAPVRRHCGTLAQPRSTIRTVMRTYELDGERFSILHEFYDEISRVLVPDATWGRNLDAFNDILRGGFGTPDEGFTLRWTNHERSRQRLPTSTPSSRSSVRTAPADKRPRTTCSSSSPERVPHQGASPNAGAAEAKRLRRDSVAHSASGSTPRSRPPRTRRRRWPRTQVRRWRPGRNRQSEHSRGGDQLPPRR
jgi:RNAse (barnase) inhibitor barstar